MKTWFLAEKSITLAVVLFSENTVELCQPDHQPHGTRTWEPTNSLSTGTIVVASLPYMVEASV
jgi:hypothetical protein